MRMRAWGMRKWDITSHWRHRILSAKGSEVEIRGKLSHAQLRNENELIMTVWGPRGEAFFALFTLSCLGQFVCFRKGAKEAKRGDKPPPSSFIQTIERSLASDARHRNETRLCERSYKRGSKPHTHRLKEGPSRP